MTKPRSNLAIAVVAAFLVALVAAPARAQSLIRDAEIERTLRDYADPVFVAAGLSPASVKIYLLNQKGINAFVAGGQNIFINTGTILELDRPGELIGIIAHETGHISGGHLARSADAMAAATIPMVVGTLLGIAAMAAGNPDAGMGIMLGGQQIAERTLLAYSRDQESAADQAAINFLNATGQSSQGLLDTFNRFRGQEVLSDRAQDPFVRTHPLSSDRLAALEQRVSKSPFADKPESAQQIRAYGRIRAKLIGFIERQDIVLRKYPLTDKSIEARYARAIAYYRIPDLGKAFAEVDAIIAEEPENPYFHELKGQILFENGRAADAVPEHAAAVKLAPNEPLLKLNLGQAMIATEDPSLNPAALQTLESALRVDPDNPFAWHQLAIAYARDGRIGMAEYATAERYSRSATPGDAIVHAQRALCELDPASPAYRRAQDIVITVVKQMEKEGRNGKGRALPPVDEADGPGCRRGGSSSSG